MKFADIKGFAFDLDGVIADTAKFHSQAWHQTATKVGTEWTPELQEALKGVSRMDSLEMILKAGGHENDYSLAEKEALAAEKNDNYGKLIATLTSADILPGMQGLLEANAIPLTAEIPMRSPVKEPGPEETAKVSTWEILRPQESNKFCTMGKMVWLWVNFTLTKFSPRSRASSHKATDAATADVSIPSISKTGHLLPP